MKSNAFFSLLALAGLLLLACKPEVSVETKVAADEPETFTYDSTLAAKLGADDYGMRKYVMAESRT